MSADLFAEFSTSKEARLSGNGQQSWPQLSHTDQQRPGQDLPVSEEDDFGAFEGTETAIDTLEHASVPVKATDPRQLQSKGAPPSGLPVPREPTKHPFAGNMDVLFAADEDEYTAGADEFNDLSNDPVAASAFSKRVIAEQQRPQSKVPFKSKPVPTPAKSVASKSVQAPAIMTPPEQSGPKKLRAKSGYVPVRQPDVLFDAENLSEDDGGAFGDFAGANPQANFSLNGAITEPPGIPNLGLLGLDDRPARRSTAAVNVSGKQHNDNNSKPPANDDEGWDDFAETTPVPNVFIDNTSSSEPRNVSHTLPRSISANASPQPAINPATSSLPPTNIPPPVILLSIFPRIFDSAQSALFQPLATLSFTQKQQLLAHPATAQFLRGFLALSTVLAHVIAGRKLRWRRDQYLSQGMRIGPAASGRSGGMKLAGVDKSEATKEEREVLDVVRLWKAQVGKLRSAVASVNASTQEATSKLPAVPDIAEVMPIRSLKASEGGITAPHACALCGLKREERVAKVDIEVEDSFGEWWVEGMSMHLRCRNFWEEHKAALRSR